MNGTAPEYILDSLPGILFIRFFNQQDKGASGFLTGSLPLLLLHLPPQSGSVLEVLAGRAGPRPAGAAPRAHACLDT